MQPFDGVLFEWFRKNTSTQKIISVISYYLEPRWPKYSAKVEGQIGAESFWTT
jgi:hypothetical protein